jgi:hypothetical protein
VNLGNLTSSKCMQFQHKWMFQTKYVLILPAIQSSLL